MVCCMKLLMTHNEWHRLDMKMIAYLKKWTCWKQHFSASSGTRYWIDLMQPAKRCKVQRLTCAVPRISWLRWKVFVASYVASLTALKWKLTHPETATACLAEKDFWANTYVSSIAWKLLLPVKLLSIKIFTSASKLLWIHFLLAMRN